MEEENRGEFVWQREGQHSRGLRERGATGAKEMERAAVSEAWEPMEVMLELSHCPRTAQLSSSRRASHVLHPRSIPPDPSSAPERMSFSSPLLLLTSPSTAQYPHTSRHYLVLIPSNLPTLQKIHKAIGPGGLEQVVMQKAHTYPRKWGECIDWTN